MTRFVGVDVGGTNVRCAVWDGGEEKPAAVRSEQLPVDYDAFIDLVSSHVRADGLPVVGVGIGLPARITGGVVDWAPNIPYLDGRNLAADLSREVGSPVVLAIDGQLALLGEAHFGAASDARDAILVSVGTGIGGAIMVGRKLLRGRNGTAGAFGWLPFAELASDVAGDRHRTWEEIASGTALEAAARRFEPPLSAAELLPAARSGHEAAGALINRFALDIGRGLAGLASIFDTELVLVSGGVSRLVAESFPEVEQSFLAHRSPSVSSTVLAVAQEPELAGAFGACVYAKEAGGVFLV